MDTYPKPEIPLHDLASLTIAETASERAAVGEEVLKAFNRIPEGARPGTDPYSAVAVFGGLPKGQVPEDMYQDLKTSILSRPPEKFGHFDSVSQYKEAMIYLALGHHDADAKEWLAGRLVDEVALAREVTEHPERAGMNPDGVINHTQGLLTAVSIYGRQIGAIQQVAALENQYANPGVRHGLTLRLLHSFNAAYVHAATPAGVAAGEASIEALAQDLDSQGILAERAVNPQFPRALYLGISNHTYYVKNPFLRAASLEAYVQYINDTSNSDRERFLGAVDQARSIFLHPMLGPLYADRYSDAVQELLPRDAIDDPTRVQQVASWDAMYAFAKGGSADTIIAGIDEATTRLLQLNLPDLAPESLKSAATEDETDPDQRTHELMQEILGVQFEDNESTMDRRDELLVALAVAAAQSENNYGDALTYIRATNSETRVALAYKKTLDAMAEYNPAYVEQFRADLVAHMPNSPLATLAIQAHDALQSGDTDLLAVVIHQAGNTLAATPEQTAMSGYSQEAMLRQLNAHVIREALLRSDTDKALLIQAAEDYVTTLKSDPNRLENTNEADAILENMAATGYTKEIRHLARELPSLDFWTELVPGIKRMGVLMRRFNSGVLDRPIGKNEFDSVL